MTREIIKEMKVGIRSGRFLILSASLVFYGLLTPIMLTVILPKVLESQFQGEDVAGLLGMLDTNQATTMASYIGDVYEMGTLLVTFVLCGLIAQEIRENTLVLPLCSGSRYHEILGAKTLVYGLFLVVVSTLALAADYFYAGLLLKFEVGFASVFAGGALMGFYLFFLVVCVMMWGALTKRPIAAGFLTLATTFGMQFVAGLFQKSSWVPSALMTEAANFSGTPAESLPITIVVTIGLIALMGGITYFRLGKLEWNGR